MVEMSFQYSLEKGEWIQCTDMELIRKDIEKLHYALLVENSDRDKDELYVRCPMHREDEKIAGFENGEIFTVTGCRFDGLVGICDNKSKYVPFRWRIFKSNDNAPVNIAADVLYVDMTYSNSPMKWRNFSFSIDIDRRKMIISKIRCFREDIPVLAFSNNLTDSMKEWTEATGVEIPNVVTDFAMEILRGEVEAKYGIKPSVLSHIKGKSRIKAFVTRPFDLNVVFLKTFLKDLVVDERSNDAFDKVFPYEQKDNYKKICDCLKIEPPRSLRKAYTFNPYSIVWYMVFRQWGINDVNLMQGFLYTDGSICGTPLQDLYYSNEYKKVLCCKRVFCDKWVDVDFYCKWLVERKREKKLLRWLNSVSKDNSISDYQWDILRAFREYFNDLSDEVKDRIARDGLTMYVHDAISTEITYLSQKLARKSVHYDDIVLSYECRINQFEFHLVHDTVMLSKLGTIFNNCVASYRTMILKGQRIIAYLINGSEYLACIEINDSGYIVQALGKYNRKLSEDVNKLVRFWAELNKIGIYDGVLEHINEADAAEMYENAVIEAIPYEKSIYDYSLDELLAFNDSDIKDGYYLRLQEKLWEEEENNIIAPAEENFANEKCELMSINPRGERIYEAAFSGNTEAMRALGYMYQKGEGVRQDNNKALEWFMKAADMNDEFAKSDAKQLGLEMGIIGSLKDQDMYYFLKEMKHGREKEVFFEVFLERFLKYNIADVNMEKIRERINEAAVNRYH